MVFKTIQSKQCVPVQNMEIDRKMKISFELHMYICVATPKLLETFVFYQLFQNQRAETSKICLFKRLL